MLLCSIYYICKMDSIMSEYDFQSSLIFSNLSEQEAEMFRQASETFVLKKNQLLYREKSIPTGAYLLIHGKVKAYKTALDGRNQFFNIYKSGDLIGYHPILCNERYADSCETLEECKFSFIDIDAFNSLLEKIPHVNQQLIQNMSHEFGVMVNTITIMAHQTLRYRFALYLLVLNKRYRNDDGVFEGINLSREDLANYIGTTREGLGKLLKEFREDELIKVDKRTIFINNEKKLIEIVNSVYS